MDSTCCRCWCRHRWCRCWCGRTCTG